MVNFILICAIIFSPQPAQREEIRIAVASNFSAAMTAIAKQFENKTGYKVTLVSGATGMLYAQIKNGAPVDVFFAADVERPALLEKEKLAAPGSRFTYAVGKIVLWSPKKNYVDADGKILATGVFHHIAIANPKLAPYGKAAEAVLRTRGLWDKLSKHLVLGENISQTYEFIQSGNAEVGFVALSQIKHPGAAVDGSCWIVPQSLYSPIEQQAVQISTRKEVSAFMSFVRSKEAREIIRNYGYETP